MKDEVRKELQKLKKRSFQHLTDAERLLPDLLEFGKKHFDCEPFVTQQAINKSLTWLRLLIRDYLRTFNLMELTDSMPPERIDPKDIPKILCPLTRKKLERKLTQQKPIKEVKNDNIQ